MVIPNYNVLVACKDKKYTLINSAGKELFATIADDIYMTISGGEKHYYIAVNDQLVDAEQWLDKNEAVSKSNKATQTKASTKENSNREERTEEQEEQQNQEQNQEQGQEQEQYQEQSQEQQQNQEQNQEQGQEQEQYQEQNQEQGQEQYQE